MKRLVVFSAFYTCVSALLAGACWISAAQAEPTPALVQGIAAGFILAFAVAHITAMVDTISRRRSP